MKPEVLHKYFIIAYYFGDDNLMLKKKTPLTHSFIGCHWFVFQLKVKFLDEECLTLSLEGTITISTTNNMKKNNS